jgi:hypothetical protein
MRFEIEFDKDIYNKQMDLLFDLAWKRKKDYYKNAQYSGVILIFIGVLLIFTVKRENLLLITKDYGPYILGKEEVGEKKL